MTKRPLQLTLRVMLPRPDPFLNGVYLDRTSVDFGLAAAGGGGEAINLTNNSNTKVFALYTLKFAVATVFLSHGRDRARKRKRKRETERERDRAPLGRTHLLQPQYRKMFWVCWPTRDSFPTSRSHKITFWLSAVLTNISFVSAVDVRVHPGSINA